MSFFVYLILNTLGFRKINLNIATENKVLQGISFDISVQTQTDISSHGYLLKSWCDVPTAFCPNSSIHLCKHRQSDVCWKNITVNSDNKTEE